MEKGKKGKRKKISKNLSRSFDPRRVKGSTKEGREEEREVLFLARAKTGTANLLPESWTRQKLPLPHLHRPRDRIARHDVSINYEGTPANGDPSPPPHTHTHTFSNQAVEFSSNVALFTADLCWNNVRPRLQIAFQRASSSSSSSSERGERYGAKNFEMHNKGGRTTNEGRKNRVVRAEFKLLTLEGNSREMVQSACCPPLPSAARLSVKEFGASRPQSRLLITVRCCCVCPGFRGATHRRKEVEAVAFRAFSFARRLSFEMDERRNVGKAWKKKKL